MISTTNRIASDSNVTVWIKEEVTPGSGVIPEAVDIVSAFDITYPFQVPEYTNSKEKAQTRDVLDRCQGKWPAGEWGFSTNVRPNGPGIVPAEDKLVYGATCKRTIDPGVDVAYDPDLIKPSFTIWFLIDHTMVFCHGATVGGAELSLAECALEWAWNGKFMRMGHVGTTDLTFAVAPAQDEAAVVDARQYSVGGFIVLADQTGAIVDDNGGAGYQITAVDVDVNTITVTPVFVVGAASTGIVAPLDPGGSVVGERLQSKSAVVSFDGTDKAILDFTWKLTDEADYLEKERTPSGFPESYAETQREVAGEIELSFRRDDASTFYGTMQGVYTPIALTVGETDGYKLILTMPKCTVDVPKPEEETPIVKLVTAFTALATTGEDSFKVEYK